MHAALDINIPNYATAMVTKSSTRLRLFPHDDRVYLTAYWNHNAAYHP
jgi:hypothetical protein